MKKICVPIPTDLHHDLNRIKELENRTLISMIIEGTRNEVKELGTKIAESRRRRTTLNNMVDF